MANTLISFMAKLTPELLEECANVFSNADCDSTRVPKPEDILRARDAIRDVRAADAALSPAPKRRGRPRGSRTVKAMEVQSNG